MIDEDHELQRSMSPVEPWIAAFIAGLMDRGSSDMTELPAGEPTLTVVGGGRQLKPGRYLRLEHGPSAAGVPSIVNVI